MGRGQRPRARAARDGRPARLQHGGVSPFDQVDWELRTAEIKDEKGRVIFQQTDCEIPKALEPAGHQRRGEQVLLRRARNTPERETSVRAAGRPRDPDDRRLGPRRRLFRHRRRTPSGSTTS